MMSLKSKIKSSHKLRKDPKRKLIFNTTKLVMNLMQKRRKINLDNSLNVELGDPQKRGNLIKVYKDWNKI